MLKDKVYISGSLIAQQHFHTKTMYFSRKPQANYVSFNATQLNIIEKIVYVNCKFYNVSAYLAMHAQKK